MRIRQKVLGILLTATLLSPLLPGQVFAGTGIIYIYPGSSSLQVGSSETLALRINPGTTVDGVQATVSYNAAYLRLNSVDTSGSPFSVQLQKSYGGGTITLALGNLSGGVSSDSLIANMNFTALAGSGSTSLTISNANATSSGAYTNPSASGASVSFTSPPPSSGGGGGGSNSGGGGSSGGGSTGGSSSSGSGGSSHGSSSGSGSGGTSSPSSTPGAPAASPNSTAKQTPVKLKAELTATGYTSATFKATSNQPVSMYVLWGSDAKHLTNESKESAPTKSATLTMGDDKLTPGTTYYYQVVGKAGDGKLTELPVGHLLTAGFTVRVTVLDADNNLLRDTKVTLHSRVQTAVTDSNGVATFTDVAPGVHHLEYASGGHVYSSVVYVQDKLPAAAAKGKDVKLAAQTAAAVLPVRNSGGGSSPLIAILIILGGLAIYVLGVETNWIRLHLHGRHLAHRLIVAGRAMMLW